jgi:copper chaperone NosL
MRNSGFRGFVFRLTQTLTLTVTAVAMAVLILAVVPDTSGGQRGPVKPSTKDKCPVCGMFVAKYPDFLAEILFKDGTYAVFDGTKDMFKYYLNLKKYNASKRTDDIEAVYVTDYYKLSFMDGVKAVYVIGSDIYGPMGRELIPFEKENDAKEFMKDHKGKAILKFGEINTEIVRSLD